MRRGTVFRGADSLSQLDVLTGLFNRRGWEKLLALEKLRCQQFGHAAGVVILDLGYFKDGNHTHGHAAGDRLLQTAATSIQQSLRAENIVAHLGGDEFGILLVEIEASKSRINCSASSDKPSPL